MLVRHDCSVAGVEIEPGSSAPERQLQKVERTLEEYKRKLN